MQSRFNSGRSQANGYLLPILSGQQITVVGTNEIRKSKMKRLTTASVLFALSMAHVAHAQYNQTRGTVLGGLTGAAAGAIIGDNSDEAGAGAAIGGVVGALAGSLLGSAEDDRARYEYAARQQQYYQQQNYRAALAANAAAQAVTIQDVVAMARSGVSDAVIATAIQQRGLRQPLQVADIVYLSQNGVGDSVIRTMQQFGAQSASMVQSSFLPTTRIIATRPAQPVVIHHRGYHAPRCNGYSQRPVHVHHRSVYIR